MSVHLLAFCTCWTFEHYSQGLGGYISGVDVDLHLDFGL